MQQQPLPASSSLHNETLLRLGHPVCGLTQFSALLPPCSLLLPALGRCLPLARHHNLHSRMACVTGTGNAGGGTVGGFTAADILSFISAVHWPAAGAQVLLLAAELAEGASGARVLIPIQTQGSCTSRPRQREPSNAPAGRPSLVTWYYAGHSLQDRARADVLRCGRCQESCRAFSHARMPAERAGPRSAAGCVALRDSSRYLLASSKNQAPCFLKMAGFSCSAAQSGCRRSSGQSQKSTKGASGLVRMHLSSVTMASPESRVRSKGACPTLLSFANCSKGCALRRFSGWHPPPSCSNSNSA